MNARFGSQPSIAALVVATTTLSFAAAADPAGQSGGQLKWTPHRSATAPATAAASEPAAAPAPVSPPA